MSFVFLLFAVVSFCFLFVSFCSLLFSFSFLLFSLLVPFVFLLCPLSPFIPCFEKNDSPTITILIIGEVEFLHGSNI